MFGPIIFWLGIFSFKAIKNFISKDDSPLIPIFSRFKQQLKSIQEKEELKIYGRTIPTTYKEFRKRVEEPGKIYEIRGKKYRGLKRVFTDWLADDSQEITILRYKFQIPKQEIRTWLSLDTVYMLSYKEYYKHAKENQLLKV